MFQLRVSKDAQKAIYIGSLCSLSYLAVYIARNILGAVSPQIEATGVFDKAFIGSLSSVYFTCYAVGQLINGLIGEKIKAKYMISLGLIFAGICNFLLPLLTQAPTGVLIAYGATGFFLAMIYAPMTKVVAENTKPIYATRCSLGYTFASFFGSPTAGILAGLMAWQSVFLSSSTILALMGVLCFVFFTVFEKRGLVQYGRYQAPRGQTSGGIKLLLKRQIIKFTLVAILTGITRTTVVFWLTTYISEYLNFPTDTAALLFTVATLVISTTTFIAVFVYERLGHNMDKTLLLMFSVSAASFLLVFLCKVPFLNLAFMVLAIMASNGAATMLWSRYCPSLVDTGMVSSATGFLDFTSYMAASASSTIFASAVGIIGWSGLILVWFALMAAGAIISLPFDKLRKKAL